LRATRPDRVGYFRFRRSGQLGEDVERAVLVNLHKSLPEFPARKSLVREGRDGRGWLFVDLQLSFVGHPGYYWLTNFIQM
jgi:hypothetical protein